ncbi:MAG: hypothetical protein Q4B80_02030 [Aerococcaceae bacterium]|nr:hypothetical protein [Aerococcaceae bacterium]
MFYEFITTQSKKKLIYHTKRQTVTEIPVDQLQLVQTFRFRLLIAVTLYAVLTYIKLSALVSALLSILLWMMMTLHFYRHILGGLQWQSLAKADNHWQTAVTQHFAQERSIARIGFNGLLAILACVAVFTQSWQPLEQLALYALMAFFVLECAKQVTLLLSWNQSQ